MQNNIKNGIATIYNINQNNPHNLENSIIQNKTTKEGIIEIINQWVHTDHRAMQENLSRQFFRNNDHHKLKDILPSINLQEILNNANEISSNSKQTYEVMKKMTDLIVEIANKALNQR